MIFGYKKGLPGVDPYWYGKVGGTDRKFIRVVAGLIFPHLEHQGAAVIVLAEMMRSFGPADLTAVACHVGPWPKVENAIVQMRRDLKFDTLLTDSKASLDALLNNLSSPFWAVGEIPLVGYDAGLHALGETGRQVVNQMLTDKRLHLDDDTRTEMEIDVSQATKALQCAVCWMRDNPVIYQNAKESEPLKYKRVAGSVGL